MKTIPQRPLELQPSLRIGSLDQSGAEFLQPNIEFSMIALNGSQHTVCRDDNSNDGLIQYEPPTDSLDQSNAAATGARCNSGQRELVISPSICTPDDRRTRRGGVRSDGEALITVKRSAAPSATHVVLAVPVHIHLSTLQLTGIGAKLGGKATIAQVNLSLPCGGVIGVNPTARQNRPPWSRAFMVRSQKQRLRANSSASAPPHAVRNRGSALERHLPPKGFKGVLLNELYQCPLIRTYVPNLEDRWT